MVWFKEADERVFLKSGSGEKWGQGEKKSIWGLSLSVRSAVVGLRRELQLERKVHARDAKPPFLKQII